MKEKIKLITTDSYFNVFEILKKELAGKTEGLSGKNLIFCDEKISLMAERHLCSINGGSFNTQVYSFGNYLRVKKGNLNALSKEGSAMAIRKILGDVNLKKFSSSKTDLAPTLYELIMQLKSASVSPEEIKSAISDTDGVLSFKLEDIFAVYSAYEDFLLKNGFEDQSSSLSYLPKVLSSDNSIKDANVFLLGFTGWTRQARDVIETLIKRAMSVTAIVAEGENEFLFVNETAESFLNICKKLSVPVKEERKIQSDYSVEGRILIDSLFNPDSIKRKKIKTDKVFIRVAPSVYKEVLSTAETIKKTVMEKGCKYKDVTIAVPDTKSYKTEIESAFSALNIPYFFDERKKAVNNPLISLIVSYLDAIRLNLSPKALREFIKNPLVLEDKNFADKFENYLIKYNIGYARFLNPFSLGKDEEDFAEFEKTRERVSLLLKEFNVNKLLKELSVKEKITAFSKKLKDAGENIEGAVNDQIYDQVCKILEEMEMILSGVNLSILEFKKIFLSGISALELSIIPQYNDAVFIGSMKETALSKAKYLFVLGLDQTVPSLTDDVSLLSDDDIDRLELKFLIEPKIRIVNDRVKEHTGMALGAFSDKLILSYPVTAKDGKKNSKSEILVTAERLFETNSLKYTDGYLTLSAGLKTFARDLEKFTSGKGLDFTTPTAFYYAMQEDERVKSLLDRANSEVKLKLEDFDRELVNGYISPTLLEGYFACPYKAFLTNTVGIEEREKGEIDARIAGNFFHAVLHDYIKRMASVKDRESSDALVNQIVASLIEKEEYSKYLLDDEGNSFMQRVISEVQKYCYKNYCWLLRSKFKPKHLEVKIEDKNPDLQEVSLCKGKVKIRGTIDRIDYFNDYARIIDYKSGSIEIKDKELFAGVKLQLYLYSKALKNAHLAGAYYLPINDSFKGENEKLKPSALGKTLDDADVVTAQDYDVKTGESDFLRIDLNKNKEANRIDESTLLSYTDYAVLLSEKAIEQINAGVIAPTPYEDTCKYCVFKGMCENEQKTGRKVKEVNKDVIVKSVGVADEG